MTEQYQQNILDWLSSVPSPALADSADSSAPEPNLKRRRSHTLPSPTMSYDDNPASPPKRMRMDVSYDFDATPTQQRIRSTGASAGYGSPNRTSSPSKASQSSKASSSLSIALLGQNRVVTERSFNELTELPPPLKTMVRALKRDHKGNGIISQSTMDTLEASFSNNPHFEELLLDSSTVDRTGARASFGVPPRPDIVLDILAEALECEKKRHSEASWNCAVHYPLLKEALRGASANVTPTNAETPHVKCLNATTASLILGYAPASAGIVRSTRVDFCCYLDLQHNPAVFESLQKIVRGTANPHINHTDYKPLLDRPLCISMETKRPGEEWDNGLGKMSSWLYGQWRRLQEHTDTSGIDSSHIFLPGFVVLGHDWHFVAATQGEVQEHGEREIILWADINIGSTKDVGGIYSIIAAIQRLAHWSAYTYWPWFREAAITSRR